LRKKVIGSIHALPELRCGRSPFLILFNVRQNLNRDKRALAVNLTPVYEQ
jgi:hypothetical protein